ncbi:homoaconitate hydratase family protein [Thermovirga lienii DSM 17291]|uniref:3-isopropylmalate dehydratase large subunit n=1 Tax=Thermovirga lienii (strain ATCC BAA-1197 / DSM 17291 / Cas60314) TaxID=580340 RepID=G7V910_THELD|nr:3-isopropylmalate dehydratase large subunit [Thermovirga lienii]AER67544.1 homoaconitate hydratase family protein [Thermovirga lienii DSM 17291]
MSGMTIAEKILAKHSQKEKVKPGEFILADIDFAFGSDITFPIAMEVFNNEIGAEEVFDPTRVGIVLDHYYPAKDTASASNHKAMREFAEKFHLISLEGEGIEHVIIHEKGFVAPGELIIGADSHTTTYGALAAFATGVGSTDLAAAMVLGKIWLQVPESIKVVLKGKPGKWVMGKDIILHVIGEIGVSGATYNVLEFSGEGLKHLSIDDRFTISNMAIEAGAKAGIFAFDEITRKYIENRLNRKYVVYESDEEADYKQEIEINLSELRPVVAMPNSPGNARCIDDVKEKIRINQVVIGSCTNGRYSDLLVASQILEGRKIHPKVRVLVFPGSNEIYLKAIKEGVIEKLIEAGASIGFPSCGPCFGGHMGNLAPGEVAVSTTNRNFVGRMGSKDAKVILASPAVAAASAVLGYLASPEELE